MYVYLLYWMFDGFVMDICLMRESNINIVSVGLNLKIILYVVNLCCIKKVLN